MSLKYPWVCLSQGKRAAGGCTLVLPVTDRSMWVHILTSPCLPAFHARKASVLSLTAARRCSPRCCCCFLLCSVDPMLQVFPTQGYDELIYAVRNSTAAGGPSYHMPHMTSSQTPSRQYLAAGGWAAAGWAAPETDARSTSLFPEIGGTCVLFGDTSASICVMDMTSRVKCAGSCRGHWLCLDCAFIETAQLMCMA